MAGKNHASAYALTYVYTLKDQKAKILAGSKDQMRLWVNGTLAYEADKLRAASRTKMWRWRSAPVGIRC